MPTTRAALLSILLLVTAAGTVRSQARPGTTDSLIVEAPNGPWSLKTGERFRGATADGRRLEGRVLAQSDSDLVIGRRAGWFNTPADSSRVSYGELVRIEAHRPPRHRGTAMTIGMVGGLAAGAFLGAQSVKNSCHGSGGGVGPCFSRESAVFLGAAYGMGLGSATAWLFSRPRWHVLSVTRPAQPQDSTPR